MALIGFGGNEVEAIICSAVGTEVFKRDESGNQAATEIDMQQLESLEGAPSNCPLLLPINERKIGSFAVCGECSNAAVQEIITLRRQT